MMPHILIDKQKCPKIALKLCLHSRDVNSVNKHNVRTKLKFALKAIRIISRYYKVLYLIRKKYILTFILEPVLCITSDFYINILLLIRKWYIAGWNLFGHYCIIVHISVKFLITNIKNRYLRLSYKYDTFDVNLS